MARSGLAAAHEPWTSVANNYGCDVGRTSSRFANRLLQLAHDLSPISAESLILDNGAGTGAVTLAIASQSPSAKIIATDVSASMLDNISARRLPNVSTWVVDARVLSESLGRENFTHVFNTFVLQTITTPLDALREMYSVLKPGGVIGVGIWAQRNGAFDIWQQSCQIIDPSYRLPEPFDDPKAWRTQEELESALQKAGFCGIKSEEVMEPFPFESAETFAEFVFGKKNPAVVQCMSNWTGSLSEVKEAMIGLVREKYANGKEIYLWAVLGVGRKI